jgi:D-alanine-D-alanine ligase-like ATP-grasp enzyme
LQNKQGIPVALPPTEIETDYSENQIFDFRKKYLPSRQVAYHCPPRFSNEVIEKIQIQAEQLFSVFGMMDFARFDGFLLPDGNIWFSDFNPISGMEQNSFLFQQASRIGFSHQDLLRFILNNAFARRDIDEKIENIFIEKDRKPVAVLFGGETAEKQVSLMSGTNVWLKLRGSQIYKPIPYLLGKNKEIWELPYSYILNHTVEEILQNAENAKDDIERLFFLIKKVKIKLCINDDRDITEEFFMPKKHSLEDFLKDKAFVFSALHGGFGEGGDLQKILEEKNIKYNGCDSKVSKLCMDKWATNEKIEKAGIPGVSVAPHVLLHISQIPEVLKDGSINTYWEMLLKHLGTKTFIAKPRGDGCSAGVVRLFNKGDLSTYLSLIKNKTSIALPNTFTNQTNAIDMPEGEMQDIIFEAFIETDKLKVKSGKIVHTPKTGYLEMTVGVIEENPAHEGGGKIHALSPSITVAEMAILSVEEKFQGGTGVNITPPPTMIISAKNLEKVKKSIEEVAKMIGIRGYSRIDIFVHVKTGNIIVIEINTLPGLTPSTVIFHQALAEKTLMMPTQFLELLIENSGY